MSFFFQNISFLNLGALPAESIKDSFLEIICIKHQNCTRLGLTYVPPYLKLELKLELLVPECRQVVALPYIIKGYVFGGVPRFF